MPLHMNGGGYFYFQDATVGGNNQSAMGGGLDDVNALTFAIVYRAS